MFTLPPDDSVSYLVGNAAMKLETRGLPPYDDLTCDFLSNLSSRLLNSPEAKSYSDVVAFAFWCRKANLSLLKSKFVEEQLRLGLGIVFHITPSNVPVNFAFSFAISLLAGNANIVRVPSKPFVQIEIICSALRSLLEMPVYSALSAMTAFIRYEKNDEITGLLSAQCDARIIWGGNETVRRVRQLPLPDRGREVIFPDRYSFSVLSAEKVAALDNLQLHNLAGNFYNDTYSMDQNACSSPRLLVWLGNSDIIDLAKKRFWQSVYEIVNHKYELPPVNAVDKYVQICRDAIGLEDILKTVQRCDNYIYRLELSRLPEEMDRLQMSFGYFYEYETEDINTIAPIVNSKYQTLTYFGVEKQVFINFAMSNRISGIDRIVPIGAALDISVEWDGHDLIRSLSRIIEIK